MFSRKILSYYLYPLFFIVHLIFYVIQLLIYEYRYIWMTVYENDQDNYLISFSLIETSL